MLDRFLKRTNADDDAKETLILWKDSPQAKLLKLQNDAERVKAQSRELEKLEPLRRERDLSLPKLQAKRIEAEKREETALAEAKRATGERISAADAEATKSWWFDHQEELVIAAVKNLAPNCIDDFLFELRELETATRLSGRHEVREIKTNTWTGQLRQKFVSNGKSVQKRIDAIRGARTTAEELKLQPLAETEIVQRLEKLKADLPAIDQFDEVTDVLIPDVSELRRTAL